MINHSDLTQITPNLWEIPRSLRADMRVPARVFVNDPLLEKILLDRSLEQLVNVTTLPGIYSHAVALPDIHQGYGFPVGTVAAIRREGGVISPGGIGYDINCGVRLLISEHSSAEVAPFIEEIATAIAREVPSGVGEGGRFRLSVSELDDVLNRGLLWARDRGYASDDDLEVVEEHGHFQEARSEYVSDRAKERGASQLGTIGAGNHFVEIQRVSQLFDRETAAVFGLHEDQVCVLIHTGSRGLGYQTCTDYLRLMASEAGSYLYEPPDRQLCCAPLSSAEGARYLHAMAAAANYAWTNRQLITYQVRLVFTAVSRGRLSGALRLLYDVSHNIAKLEEYDGVACVVHRKGATRSFGPGRPELPARYQKTGQPVLVPGSMGTSSYVLAGTETAMKQSFGSCCHGAGRLLSRTAAKRTLDYDQLRRDLSAQGIVVRAGSAHGLLEEAPEAYKDVDEVIRVIEACDLSRPVAKLVPLAVIKG